MTDPRRLDRQPWMDTPATLRVMAAIGAGNDEARFVGGCVRNTLLGRPIADIDIATIHLPERVMELLRAAEIKAIPTGIEHGTVTAVTDSQPFEITTLRRDVETDGRRAVVAFTTDWHEDAARRDITMNAMFLDCDSQLDDPFGGYEDTLAGRVRFVGDARTRIREDVLRILRFFRCYAHYGQPPMDAEGLAACRELAPLLPELSGERIQTELLKLLAAQEPSDVLSEMASSGIWPILLPSPITLDALRPLFALQGDRIDPLLRLAAMIESDPDATASRLRLSNADGKRLRLLVSERIDPSSDRLSNRRAIHRFRVEPYRDILHLSAARAGITDPAVISRAMNEKPPPAFPIKGRDLMALGMPGNVALGRILDKTETWWIEGDFMADKSACLEQAKVIASKET
ncbi:MAG: CCA tRNA nucleotidyltransferase [Rhodospirillaceae bacterium]|nr:CCA tRNA nucleotidyltransferase [Rhodospirillaceae bacterium]MBT6137948.1 CCA tRNA nucleotidyltransferase [Rhodospirillaceae bacterium]